MRKLVGALICALVVSLAIVASASAEQGNLTAADYTTGAEFTDINAAKAAIKDETPSPLGVSGHIFLTYVRIATGETETDGLIQAGWISSHGTPSSLTFDDCIPAGTIIRGYFVEWKNTGVGLYHCQYWPVTAQKYGKSRFEIIEPAGTWRVLKDGKNILTNLTLNFVQGKAKLGSEFVQFAPQLCIINTHFGTTAGDPQNPDPADSFFVRHTGGSYQLVAAATWVYDAPPPGDPREWTASFGLNLDGISNGGGIGSFEYAGWNGC